MCGVSLFTTDHYPAIPRGQIITHVVLNDEADFLALCHLHGSPGCYDSFSDDGYRYLSFAVSVAEKTHLIVSHVRFDTGISPQRKRGSSRRPVMVGQKGFAYSYASHPILYFVRGIHQSLGAFEESKSAYI